MVALLPEMTRASMTLHDAAAWSLPWQYLVGLLLANHGGFHEWMTYVGVSTLVLAGSGFKAVWQRYEDRWLVSWLASLLVGAVWFSLGENGGLFQVLWRVVPGLGLLRVPPRAWVLVVFSMAVLAGLGVEEGGRQGDKGARGRGEKGARRPGVRRVWRRIRGRRSRRWGQAVLMGVGLFPLLVLIGYCFLVGTPPFNLVMFGLVSPVAVALAGVAVRAPRSQDGGNLRPTTLRPRTLLGPAVGLLVAVDLLVVNATLVQARSPEVVFADGRAAAEWLAARPGRFRVYSPSYSIPQQVAEKYALELADGVDPLQLRAYADYVTRAAGLKPGGYSVTLPPFPGEGDVHTALAGVVPDAEMMGQLGVRYVAAAFPIVDRAWQPVGLFDGVFIYENERARPLPETGGAGSIVLADGTTVFQYQPRAVYAGWAISGVTASILLVAGLVSRFVGRGDDG
jgi:hypothetical protein